MPWVSPESSRTLAVGDNSFRVPQEWRRNEPFEDALVLHEMYRGMSSARFIWVDAAGHEYPMFMSDVLDLMVDARGVAGAVASGWWIVVKRGQNYGIRRLAHGFQRELAAV